MKIMDKKTGAIREVERTYISDANKSFFHERIDCEVIKKQIKKEHLPCTSISLMHYLDDNRAKDRMCLSNGECEQIDKAWWNNDWRTIINYIKKYCNEDKK